MELEKFEIEAGLKEPVTLLHLSDTHICLADERDNERKNVLAAGRIKSAFGGSNEQIEQWLDEAMAFGREQADLIHDRMSSSSLFLTGFFAISCVGCTLQMGAVTPAVSDWLVSFCYIAGLLCSCGMFAKRRELEMQQLENPEKPRGKTKNS